MALDLVALRNEILTDPTALGYAPHVASGADNEIAILLNAIRGTISVRESEIPVNRIIESIPYPEFNSLAANAKAYLQTLFTLGQCRLLDDNGNDTECGGALKTIFQSLAVTRAKLVALANRKGSRAEQLFGAGVSVSHEDVARALRPAA